MLCETDDVAMPVAVEVGAGGERRSPDEHGWQVGRWQLDDESKRRSERRKPAQERRLVCAQHGSVLLEQVARSLGCSRWQTFFRVTLPLARRGIAYGALLGFSRALGEFGATAVVAGILPGETETLALGIYSRIQLGDDSGALWLCAASFALALGAMLIAESWLRRDRR